MPSRASRLSQLEKILPCLQSQRKGPDLRRYRNDPVGYARDVLGVTLWQPVADALLALLEPPYRVSVDSGNNVGKSHGAAVACNWWYDTRPQCAIISTAPTQREVVDLLWTEIRLQRAAALIPLPNDLQPSAPVMSSGPDHYAKGYTARDVNSAQGRHRENMLFIFDEKEGVERPFWDGMKSMLRPGSGDAALVIGNPFTTTSIAYQEHRATDPEGNPTWHRVRLSSLDHPNIAAGLAGQPLPVPRGVTVSQIEAWLNDWCDPVVPGDERPTDIFWRGRTFRAGPIGEARILGLRPSTDGGGVWSDALWQCVLGPEPPIPAGALPIIGNDVAGKGRDYTAFHVRCGPVSLYHHAVNGWDHVKIFNHLLELTEEYARWATARLPSRATPIDRKQIRIQIDDDATGRAVSTLLAQKGCSVLCLNAGSAPQRPDLYPNVRSESWFLTARKAASMLVNLSRLDRATRQRIELQLLAPEWSPDMAGRRVVESKEELRKPDRLGRSPDDADAMHLAYWDGPVGTIKAVEPESSTQRPGLFGRRR